MSTWNIFNLKRITTNTLGHLAKANTVKQVFFKLIGILKLGLVYQITCDFNSVPGKVCDEVVINMEEHNLSIDQFVYPELLKKNQKICNYCHIYVNKENRTRY